MKGFYRNPLIQIQKTSCRYSQTNPKKKGKKSNEGPFDDNHRRTAGRVHRESSGEYPGTTTGNSLGRVSQKLSIIAVKVSTKSLGKFAIELLEF